MYRLKESIHVNAPIDRCFLLSTSIEIVEQTLQLAPVKGQTSGLVGDGSRTGQAKQGQGNQCHGAITDGTSHV